MQMRRKKLELSDNYLKNSSGISCDNSSDSNIGTQNNKQRSRNNSKNYNYDGCDRTVNFLNEAGPLIESNRAQKEQQSTKSSPQLGYKSHEL